MKLITNKLTRLKKIHGIPKKQVKKILCEKNNTKKEDELESDQSFEESHSDNDNLSICEDKSMISQLQSSNHNNGVKRKRNFNKNNVKEKPNKKRKKENLYFKPPTVEELNELRETENLFHSNLFRLQIEEILTEVKLKEKYKKLFNIWFKEFQENVKSIKETEDQELCNMKTFDKILKAKVPKLDVPTNTRGFFKFLQPSKISVIGSYLLGTTVGPNIIIDIIVEMPSALFQKHDYQNYRYYRKRAIYLTYIATNLNENLFESRTMIGESWMPKLQLIPCGSLSKHVKIHVQIAAQSSSFKLHRFLPEKNSIRPSWYLNSDADDSQLIPTPLYNSNILHDLTTDENNMHSAKIIVEYPNIRDGIILLKIWLQQRQPETQAHDGFNGYIITMYVLYLLFEKKLNTFMSSYQIIRNVWNNLSQTNWHEVAISMCQEVDSKSRAQKYLKYYDVVFLDKTGYHNLVSNISLNNYLWLRSEAELAVKCLSNPNIDNFQVLFMKRIKLYTSFDHIICLHDIFALQELADTKVMNEKKLDFGVNKRRQVIQLITKLLTKGLGTRIQQLYVLPDNYKQWELNKNYDTNAWRPIVIGLQLNSEFSFNVIDKGPPANLPEAKEFRNFWGKKSELRRFQDGAICEAVVWANVSNSSKDNPSLADKRIICKKIVMYLLASKLHLFKHQYFYGGNQIEESLQLQRTSITKFNYGTGEEASLQVMKVFNVLEKQIISLSDLPLAITAIQAISPVFKYTDVFPPLATVYVADDKTNTRAGKNCILFGSKISKRWEVPKYAPAIEATIQLSTSGKWPDGLEAVRKTKAAFHIQIAQCLRKEHNYQVKASVHHVDIFKDGFVFRMRIAHEKEIVMLKKNIDEHGLIEYRDTDESLEIEKKLFHLPKLNGALYGLHSQQPSFGPTCCLAKRWLSAQLIDSSHIPDIVIELIVAFIYLSPDPYKPVHMPQVAFLRFLDFFANDFKWETQPVIINFNDELSREQVIEIENEFGISRSSLPALFIATPYDKTSMWTCKSPSKLILNRINSLAKEALKLVDVELSSTFTLLQWKRLFKPPLSAYDCLIYIKTEFNPRRYQYFDLNDNLPQNSWHPYKYHSEQKLPIVEFNPVELYLDELRSGYGDLALFFHDTYGGEVIGVLFNPGIFDKKDLKIANMNQCRKLDNDNKLVLNFDALFEDFTTIGHNIIAKIDIQKNILG